MADHQAKEPTDEPQKVSADVQMRSGDFSDEGISRPTKMQTKGSKSEAHVLKAASNQVGHPELGEKVVSGRKKAPAKYEKAPEAPKRFKSAFILFSADKHKQIRAQMGELAQKERTATISKLVAEAWRVLPPEEVEKWEALARNDRNRYETEKSQYNGPWHVLKTRKRKDASAPKRPMSAFLAFANCRRADVKRTMPGASNGDVSRALATMWKEAPAEVRQRYIDDEVEKRNEYLAAVADWKKNREGGKILEQLHSAEPIEATNRIDEVNNTVRKPDTRFSCDNDYDVAAIDNGTASPRSFYVPSTKLFIAQYPL